MADVALPSTAREPAVELLEETALAPMRRTGPSYYVLIGALLAVVGLGVFAYSIQLRRGLSVTGMAATGDKVMWGLYITNFVFFIGISHAGTLISAILRITQASWRTSITRMAEFITVVALIVGALFPIFDLGRPDRMLNVFAYGRWPSPILWDFFAITTYLVGSVMYLYLPLIPDLATCRDRLALSCSRRKAWLYRTLALGWNGSAGGPGLQSSRFSAADARGCPLVQLSRRAAPRGHGRLSHRHFRASARPNGSRGDR